MASTCQERYAKALVPVIEKSDAAGKGINYDGMRKEAKLSYQQVALGLHYIRNHSMLINGKPLCDFTIGRTHYYLGAKSRDEAVPYVRRSGRYATTLVTTLNQVVEDIVAVHGTDPAWFRLQIDVGRVKQDLELMTMP